MLTGPRLLRHSALRRESGARGEVNPGIIHAGVRNAWKGGEYQTGPKKRSQCVRSMLSRKLIQQEEKTVNAKRLFTALLVITLALTLAPAAAQEPPCSKVPGRMRFHHRVTSILSSPMV